MRRDESGVGKSLDSKVVGVHLGSDYEISLLFPLNFIMSPRIFISLVRMTGELALISNTQSAPRKTLFRRLQLVLLRLFIENQKLIQLLTSIDLHSFVVWDGAFFVCHYKAVLVHGRLGEATSMLR